MTAHNGLNDNQSRRKLILSRTRVEWNEIRSIERTFEKVRAGVIALSDAIGVIRVDDR